MPPRAKNFVVSIMGHVAHTFRGHVAHDLEQGVPPQADANAPVAPTEATAPVAQAEAAAPVAPTEAAAPVAQAEVAPQPNHPVRVQAGRRAKRARRYA